ncbi:LytR C-terminal domain-containing protein [Bogoriella caseilytica]|uniref:LytR cell envelope-related transcriptional attenuator n=1 Tax=Bogoriella caseilytica TaxID=56055 RepID=A0A3N2BDE9_9MICO|nr:LytR C-terminal domain-containing protein [Bogoriella caseilytica]ROR73262.1 LytR cell envelope-related transcriptional attenuator [Bogoriella caseilytica]
MSSLEEDEFDIAGRDNAPQGVHRRPRSLARVLLPIIAVLILAPLLAWATIALLARTDTPIPSPLPDPEANETVVDPDEDPGDETEDDADGEQDESTPDAGGDEDDSTDAGDDTDMDPEGDTDPDADETPEGDELPAAEVDYFAGVAVLNGTTVGGLATQATQDLVTAGFTGASAGNYASPQPTVSAVYYRDPALQATAAEVASLLGIGPVQELPGASAEVVVVLRNDFSG